MIEFSGRLDGSIATVREQCSPEEFAAYRRAVGRIMGEMLLEVLNPLYAEHPSLKPSAGRHPGEREFIAGLIGQLAPPTGRGV